MFPRVVTKSLKNHWQNWKISTEMYWRTLVRNAVSLDHALPANDRRIEVDVEHRTQTRELLAVVADQLVRIRALNRDAGAWRATILIGRPAI